MTSIDFSEDYKEALAKSSIYLDPQIGINRQDPVNKPDQVLTRQLNTLITLVVSLHNKVDTLNERLQLVEDSLKGTAAELQHVIDSLKSLKTQKQVTRTHQPLKFQVVDPSYRQI